MLMLLIPYIEPIFYIVDDVTYTSGDPFITAYDNVDPIVVAPHETVTLTFASKTYNSTEWTWVTNGQSLFNPSDNYDVGAIAMVGLFFSMESSPDTVHGQALNFQALIISVSDW